ncbi:hypothetical protein CAEBREN_19954 [Caenorhabditis brenneri]|uniref:Uncharacterized protein n=1 Tax=Caenorhabditis brenneri TaxID=135651 RepID=G0P0L0_CAEBE|nr:hypothetical protein CAEBREN_19954 [Caenorhabditis brenneri]
MESDEGRDDIKVLKEVINMKKLERDQRKMEQKDLHKTYKAYWRYDCKLKEKIHEKNAEREKKRNRKDEGEAGGDGSK